LVSQVVLVIATIGLLVDALFGRHQDDDEMLAAALLLDD
jgi:hypothetical protein